MLKSSHYPGYTPCDPRNVHHTDAKKITAYKKYKMLFGGK